MTTTTSGGTMLTLANLIVWVTIFAGGWFFGYCCGRIEKKLDSINKKIDHIDRDTDDQDT